MKIKLTLALLCIRAIALAGNEQLPSPTPPPQKSTHHRNYIDKSVVAPTEEAAALAVRSYLHQGGLIAVGIVVETRDEAGNPTSWRVSATFAEAK